MGRVEVVFCPRPRSIDRVELVLPDGATLEQALTASGMLERHGLAASSVQAGIWGKRRALDALLRDGDRVELYRPLKVDPKEARRLRYQQQGGKVPALTTALSRKRERE